MFCLNDILLANRKASREEEMIRCGKAFPEGGCSITTKT